MVVGVLSAFDPAPPDGAADDDPPPDGPAAEPAPLEVGAAVAGSSGTGGDGSVATGACAMAFASADTAGEPADEPAAPPTAGFEPIE